MSETELWQARAETLLEIFAAAQKVTGGLAVVTDLRGRVYVNREDYDRLQKAVEIYLSKCTVVQGEPG